jgi:tetratricopeptide (TPR) repeat protein
MTFDAQADDDVLRRSAPRKLTGLDLAEAKLEAGDLPTAAAMAREALTVAPGGQAVDTGRANFILARVDIMTRRPEQALDEFEKAAATAKETRILAWAHIYLGRMMDLSCRREDAVNQYKEALAVRDGEQDTRIAAERGVKKAYAPVQGHSCEADASGDGADAGPASPTATPAAKPASGDSPFTPGKPGTTVLPTPVPATAPQR